MLLILSVASVCCAALPALLTSSNLREYVAPPAAAEALPPVTVIVPARNEESGIAACVRSVLETRGVDVRVLVLDDGSTDRTPQIVREIAEADDRVQLLRAERLPAGWNGKQHACFQGAEAAETPLLCFLDADVRLHPDAVARMATLLVHGRPFSRSESEFRRRGGEGSAVVTARPQPPAALVSGFPLEETGTPMEWLLLPLIHFVLLGFLPMTRMRASTQPGLAAGCGQFLMVDREAYFAAGGHAAIRHTMHDGLLLPRLLRSSGKLTLLADLTDLASCRMYNSAASTWKGLTKNATEGLGSPGTIVPMTLLLALGQVLPLPLAIAAALRAPAALPWAWGAVVLSYLPRLLEMRRFRQRGIGVALHPVGVATLLVLQWYALGRKVLGRPAVWKQREYQVN